MAEDDAAVDDENVAEISPATVEFALEEFLVGNWSAVNWGRPLRLWQGNDGTNGQQLSTPIGRLDLLCVDTATDTLVVVEQKRGRSPDSVVGQAARYMGRIRAHLAAPGQKVQGIVVAHECDDRLRYAAAAVPGLMTMTYRVTFDLAPVPGIAAS